jgi:16S rRNA processing protein RimM
VERIVVGRIVRAHGIRGELGVRCNDPASSSLLLAKQIWLAEETAPRTVLSARAAHIEVLIRLQGIVDRTGAEGLKGRDVFVERAALPPAAEGEYYFADLVGLQAVTEDGKLLGTVQGLWETGPVPVVVIGEGEGELMVPFAEHFVVSVDLAAKQMVIRPPEYDE